MATAKEKNSPKKENYAAWEAGVPMMTNRFILYDLVIFAGAAWFFPSALISLAVALFVTPSDPVLIFAVFRLIALIVLVFLAFFALVGLVMMRNRFFVRYVINGSGVSYESARGASAGLEAGQGGYFCLRPFRGEPGQVRYQTSKWIVWEKLLEIKEHRSSRVISLCNSVLPVVRLYCPDDETYQRALAICREELERRRAPA